MAARMITIGPRVCGDEAFVRSIRCDDRFMVTMRPGDDGVVWFLCLRHFLDGIKPQKIGNPTFKITEVSPELAEAAKGAFGDHYPVKAKQ